MCITFNRSSLKNFILKFPFVIKLEGEKTFRVKKYCQRHSNSETKYNENTKKNNNKKIVN